MPTVNAVTEVTSVVLELNKAEAVALRTVLANAKLGKANSRRVTAPTAVALRGIRKALSDAGVEFTPGVTHANANGDLEFSA